MIGLGSRSNKLFLCVMMRYLILWYPTRLVGGLGWAELGFRSMDDGGKHKTSDCWIVGMMEVEGEVSGGSGEE